MATLSLRIRDDLKRKAKELAECEGVSLNNYINATLAATVAQAETLERVLDFMREAELGDEPSVDELKDALGDRF